MQEAKEQLEKDDATEVFQIKPPLNCRVGEHHFIQVKGTEVLCSRCPVGYVINRGYEVKNGHIYLHGSLVI